jgi:K+-transporting ATPase ATPase A chain
VVAIVLMWQGSPATFEGAARATTVDGAEQVIARGVTAPMVAIKQLGTNGGGYFGPNSTHPFENPTPLSNLVETWSILAIPMAMVWALGYIVGRRGLAVVIFAVMPALYLPLLAVAVGQEAAGSPAIARMGVDQSTGSMEGKEVRFGAALTALWAVSTTATSNGSVNGMHDSLTPLGGLIWLSSSFSGCSCSCRWPCSDPWPSTSRFDSACGPREARSGRVRARGRGPRA